MEKDVILYKRRNGGLRLFFLILAMISAFTVFLVIVYTLYNHESIELGVYVFPVFIFIIGVYIYFFTGYTENILVSYNEKGFYKNDIGFIQWNDLKSWNLKLKKKHWDYGYYMFNTVGKHVYNIVLELVLGTWGHDRAYCLILVLNDGKKVKFAEDEVGDIKKFITFLYHNHQDKLRGNGRLL